jgi:hypothetical protein
MVLYYIIIFCYSSVFAEFSVVEMDTNFLSVDMQNVGLHLFSGSDPDM